MNPELNWELEGPWTEVKLELNCELIPEFDWELDDVVDTVDVVDIVDTVDVSDGVDGGGV